MKRTCDIGLVLILLLVLYAVFIRDVQAQTITCTGTFSAAQSFPLSCWATGQPVLIPDPTTIPTPAPPHSACSQGMYGGDLVWSEFKDLQLWPVPAVTGSGDLGRAIRFVADSTAFPRGVRLAGVDEHQPIRPKDYVISECPHSFTPAGGNARCAVNAAASYAGPLYLRFGPARPRIVFGKPQPSLDCPLTPGGTYYINFRDNLLPRGNVSSQFVFYSRTD